MFTLEKKTSISESAINAAIGLKKERLINLKTKEELSNTLFETAIIKSMKSVWYDVLQESGIIEDPAVYDDSLTSIFENVLESVSKYDSMQLRENAAELPWFMSETVRFIETITELESTMGSSNLTKEEEESIDEILNINGKEDEVEEISRNVQKGVELSAKIGDKITEYEEKEIETRLKKMEDKEEETSTQLEAASSMMRSQNYLARNLVESIAIGNYKQLLNEGYEGEELESKTRKQTLVVFSLLETFNVLGIIENDSKSVRGLSEQIRSLEK